MLATVPTALGVLTFGLLPLAWGALAVAVPVLVHLVLRQRPRRELLPTLRFLLKAHESATRAHRLKRLILLACRMAAILLVVGILMKTGCAPSDARQAGVAASVSGPVSAVIAIDDSASMQYRYQGHTRLEDAQTWARNLIADTDRFPPGSELAIVVGSMNPDRPAGWSRDPNATTRLISDIRPAWHDRPIAALLRQSYALLATAGHERREVYLLTDLTESGWGEPPPEPPKELAGVYVLDAGRTENCNLALSKPDVPPNMLSLNQPSAVEVKIRAGDTASPGTVTLSVDGRARDRRIVAPPSPHSETSLSFTVAPLAEGAHEILLELEPDDALSLDNRRFTCVAVGRVPGVAVIGDEGSGSVATLVSAMIAPPALPPQEQRFSLVRATGTELPSTRLDKPLAVILADPAGLTAGGWQRLDQYVSAGGTLLLIPGPNTSMESYAGQDRLLPAEVKGVTTPTEPITLAAADLSHPYLKPFNDAGLDSINDRLVYRRLDLGAPRSGVITIAPFSDRSPAILEGRVGTGRVLQFAFSLDRDWGQLGTQAGPMIVLLHSILESLAPRPENIDSLTAGRLAIHRWSAPAGEYSVQGPEGTPSSLPVSEGASALPTDRPGGYRVLAGVAASQPALLYSVNVAESESDLGRLADDGVRSRFPTGLALVAHDPAGLPARRAGSGGGVSWTVPLALALLGLLCFETFFANRFYGKKAAHQAAEPADK